MLKEREIFRFADAFGDIFGDILEGVPGSLRDEEEL